MLLAKLIAGTDKELEKKVLEVLKKYGYDTNAKNV